MMHAADVPLPAERKLAPIIAENWSLVALRGAASILFGVLVIAWPNLTLLVLVWLFGIYAVLDGIFNIASGIRGVRERRRDWIRILLGVVGIAAGVIAIVWPEITALLLLVFIGAWAIVTRATGYELDVETDVEGLANAVIRDGYLVVDQLAPRFVLRSGKASLTVTNGAFSAMQEAAR